ncbi:MAG TPA: alkaline phosphatase family protein [Chloroflexota bacterium]|nr:alkaline phosphatase family protein [Chloroflexota bacterium]
MIIFNLKRLPAFALVAVMLSLTACGAPVFSAVASPSPSAVASATAIRLATPERTVAIPNFRHVFNIMMENKEYDDIIGSSSAPYLNQLARTYGLATHYYAVQHPSLPNYLSLISGSNQGINDDCPTCTVDAPNLVDQLEAAQKTWKAYLEDLPSPCFNGPAAPTGILFLTDGYVRRHNPFMYFADIQHNPARCQRTVPLSDFSEDLKANRLPNFVWISPNLNHDMHNGSIKEGDRWLAAFVPTILQSEAWKEQGALFIVWDEGTTNQGCCGVPGGGHVPALVIASDGKAGYRSPIEYTHYSLLKTIEAAWHLPYLGHAGDPMNHVMSDLFSGN